MVVKQVELVQTVEGLQQRMKELKGNTIGFVPTMGALHEGHGELITQARNQNDLVLVSIFVNPTQFGPNEDFARYPRDLAADTLFCQQRDVDIIFAPSEEEIYGRDGGITFESGPAANILCGVNRPGHFNGVLQIVAKLFMLIRPTRAYFGQKDAQQLALIDLLVRDYYFPLEIISVPIVREADGVAKSSRNMNLTPEERQQATILYETLTWIKQGLEKDIELVKLLAQAKEKIEKTSAKVEYIDLLNYPDLTQVTEDSTKLLLAAAIQFPTVRLIDNILFDK